jgi:alkanesulfonate monooxygenase SsuD/methylene tetrahydromethanopterin reductase-like flavin-dependent oxidoreductase (luciferase family)
MRLGIALPPGDAGGRPLGPRTLAEAARRIEIAGFDSAWVFDSIGRGFLIPDPLVALSVATSRRRFRVLDHSLGVMRKLWGGGRSGDAELGSAWPTAVGGPPVLIGSWAGSRWIERAARDFDGWVASGARSSWRKITDGIARFRDLGGARAVLTNVGVDLDAEPSPDRPDDPFDLRGGVDVARARLQRVCELGFDDVVLVARRHDAEHLRELRALL